MKTCPKTGYPCPMSECRPTTACWLIDRPVLRPVPEMTFEPRIVAREITVTAGRPSGLGPYDPKDAA
jgi:hypothetical protein